jgi:hypothetical protein
VENDGNASWRIEYQRKRLPEEPPAEECRRQRITDHGFSATRRESRRALFHEDAQMGLNGGGQGFQVVASFENGDEAASAILLCDGFDDARELSISPWREIHSPKQVVLGSVETGGDQHKVGLKSRRGRLESFFERF